MIVLQISADDEVRPALQGRPAQDSKQPERYTSLPTELAPLHDQTQAGGLLLGTTYQPVAAGRLHSSSDSQTAESIHLPSSMPQKEGPKDLPSSDTTQPGSGDLSGSTLQPPESTAVASSRPQADESNPLPGNATQTAAFNSLPMPSPIAPETSASQNALPDMLHDSTERTRDSGTLVSCSAQLDAVSTGESQTASNSAAQTPASGALPEGASQKTRSGALPGTTLETAALGILPYDAPKTAQSPPNSTSAAARPELLSSTTAQRAASDTLLNTTAHMDPLGGVDPTALCTQLSSAPTAESVTFPSATFRAAYSDTPTPVLQIANTAAVSLTGSPTQAGYSSGLPGSVPDVATLDTDAAALVLDGLRLCREPRFGSEQFSSLSSFDGAFDHSSKVSFPRNCLTVVTPHAERRGVSLSKGCGPWLHQHTNVSKRVRRGAVQQQAA